VRNAGEHGAKRSMWRFGDRQAVSRIALLVGLGAAAGIAYVHRGWFDAAALESWVANAGWLGPAAFIAAYAIATVLFLPGSVITLAGGALFGPMWGTAYSLAGATLGAGAAFAAARYIAADWVGRKASGRMKQVVTGVEAEGWRFVAFARLMPIVPFNLLNYALGLTRISFAGYIGATALFMIPGAFAYSWLGYAGREAIGGGDDLIRKGLIALALVAVAAFLPRLVRRLRSGTANGTTSVTPGAALDAAELARRLDRGDRLAVLDVRPAAAYDGDLGHIGGALNIPLDELPRRMSELERFRGGTVAVICRTNRMSTQALALLREAGFSEAMLVNDGMVGWSRLRAATEAAAPTIEGSSPIS